MDCLTSRCVEAKLPLVRKNPFFETNLTSFGVKKDNHLWNLFSFLPYPLGRLS